MRIQKTSLLNADSSVSEICDSVYSVYGSVVEGALTRLSDI